MNFLNIDIKDKDDVDFKMNFLNIDLKLDILTQICETIRTEKTKK
jgi:hypothetical protein